MDEVRPRGIEAGAIRARLGDTYGEFPDADASGLPVYRGKVRDVVGSGRCIAIVASDRLSAFDRVLSSLPFKGEALSRIALYWFNATSDIIPNHLAPSPMPSGTGRVTFAHKAEMLPVEVVVRGYLTGSAWRDYSAGRPVSGISLPPGLARNQKFPAPIITPSSKESSGHDLPMSCEEIVRRGVVESDLWHEVEKAALGLFRRGAELAAQRGLILVDTKYEFGLVDGKLVVADEMHTPDSSRYWYSADYPVRFSSGAEQRELDKEYFRRWLMERGFSGEGDAPVIDDDIRVETTMRYLHAFETITGEDFATRAPQAQAEALVIASSIRERLG